MAEPTRQDWGERAERLARELIRPLLLGGPVTLQRPFGTRIACAIGEERSVVDRELGGEIEIARLRTARTLLPIDALPPLGPAEWTLAAVLNDLLQLTNHELAGFATKKRHHRLLGAVRATLAAVPPGTSLGALCARHATFRRVLELERVDSQVSWWTGSASFRGQKPPPRLLAWPELRRVTVSKTSVPLPEMHGGLPQGGDEYLAALGAWLACSPLTDLATAARAAPRFRWTSTTVSVAAHVEGRNLALRAFEATSPSARAFGAAGAALEAALAELPAGGPAHTAARALCDTLAAARVRRQAAG